MIEGQSVILRAWREEDIGKLTEMRNDVKLQSQLLSRVRGSNQGQTRQWLERRSSDSGSLLFIVAERDHDTPLGYIQFIDIEPIDRTAKLGICLSGAFQGRGTGQEVLSLAFQYVSDYWAIRKITLEVREDNIRAIRCYEKMGFKLCGKYLKHKYFDGEWQNLVIMELFLDVVKS